MMGGMEGLNEFCCVEIGRACDKLLMVWRICFSAANLAEDTGT
jgi:hypothetical protein